jgi:hypothetical protein
MEKMERIFIQAVCMPIPDKIYYPGIRDELKELGYRFRAMRGWKEEPTQPQFLSNFDRLGNMGNCSNSVKPEQLSDDVQILDEYDPWLYLALASISKGSAPYPGEWIKTAANEICIIERLEDEAVVCLNTATDSESILQKEDIYKLSREEVISAINEIRLFDQQEKDNLLE